MSNQSVTNIANAIINKINSLISSHNSNSNAHQDIRESIPSATSELNNNSGFITSSSVPNASNTTPSADTTSGSVGTGTAWARSDHTHPKSSLYAEAEHIHSLDTLRFGNDFNNGWESISLFTQDNDNKSVDMGGIITLDYSNNEAKAIYYRNLEDYSKDYYEIATINDVYTIREGIGEYVSTVALSNDYNDLDNKPDIPLYTSDLTNDSGFLTSHQDITGKEDKSNKVTSLSSSSTDTQYPSAKAVYDSLDVKEDKSNKVTSISSSSTHTQYPSAKAVYDSLDVKEDKSNKVTSISSSSTHTQYPSAKAVYDATFNLDTLDCINENFTILSLPQIVFTYNEDSFDGAEARLLRYYDDGAYVDWGDGTPIETYESTDILSHNYSDNVQEHTITIYGNIQGNTLGNYSFRILTGMTSINIPSNVTSLGGSCFSACTGLTNVTIPSSVTSIGSGCFNGCTGLTNITIPSSVTSIGGSCFNACTGLTSVTIPSSVTSLGNECFRGCTGLTSVTIPSSVTNLGINWFYKCTNLVDYQLYWETPPVNWSSTRMPNNTDTYFTIPNGTTANYTAKGFPSDKLVERSE